MHLNAALSMTSGSDLNASIASFGVIAYSYTANVDLSGYAYILSKSAGIKLRSVGSSVDIGFIVGGTGPDF